jgi:hypothetical protein
MSVQVKKKLLKVDELPDMWAVHHLVENTDLHIIELLNFGFSYASRYVLLRSNSNLQKLKDESFSNEFCKHPSRYGSTLEFGTSLERGADGEIFYVGLAR